MTTGWAFLDTHFWLLCGLWVGGVGSLIYYAQMSRHVKAGRLDATDRSRFVRGWLGVIGSTSLIFWLLQLSAGTASSPHFISWPSPQRWLALLVQAALWVWLLWWVFLRGGAEFLARITSVGTFPFRGLVARPAAFRILAILIVASGVLGLTLMYRQ